MKRLLVLAFVFAVYAPPAEAQLLRRIFGGRQQVQQNACYQQPVYSQPVYQAQAYYPNYQAVAAIPLATIPVAVDLQAYQYSVNATAFQSFRDYQAAKAAPAQPEATQVAAQQATAGVVGNNSEAPTGAVVLKNNCIKCHQAGNSPKGGLAMFDQKGELYGNLPLADIMERITAEEPAARMPPGKTLAPHDATAVLRLASSVLISPGERTAAVEPTKPRNPFE